MRTPAVLCIVLLSFAAYSQSVKTKFVNGFDAKKYSTFRVDKGDLVVVAEQRTDEKLFYDNVKESVRGELEKKGYQYLDDSLAQLVITYVAEGVVKMEVENLGPLGQQPVSDPSQVNASRNWSREYSEASLVLTMIDAATKKTVWTATSTLAVESVNDPRIIKTIVFRALKKFPKHK
jgi:hypothetical protein